MHCFEIQGLACQKMSQGTQTRNQSEHVWLDLSEYRDVMIWVDVHEIVLAATTFLMNFQTSATEDEALFQTIATLNLASVGPGAYVLPVHIDTAAIPLARWLRWQLMTQGVTSRSDVTFQAWAAAGGRSGTPYPTNGR
jgi:hypothetical protein